MQKKTKKAFIVYEFDQFQNDYKYIKEYYNTSEIVKDYKLNNVKSVYHYIAKTIDNTKQLLNNKYVIIQERL